MRALGPTSPAARLVAVLLLALAACGPSLTGGTAGPPDEPPYLAGEVTDVTTTQPVTTDCISESDLDPDGTVTSDDPPVCDPDPGFHGTLLVEGQGSGGEDAAFVGVAKDVPLVDEAGEQVRWEDIAAGMRVQVWITGEVAESYPVQVTATHVVVAD